MSRVVFKRERFVIERRAKPMVAPVSTDDRERLEREGQGAPMGLLPAVWAWADFEELDETVEEIYRRGLETRGRVVPPALERHPRSLGGSG